jgi:hypothetical protein
LPIPGTKDWLSSTIKELPAHQRKAASTHGSGFFMHIPVEKRA